MKKALVLLGSLLMLFPLRAAADEQSEALLTKLQHKIKAFTSYRIDFTATMSGKGSTQGTLTAQGNRFYVKLMGQELFYNGGDTLWSYVAEHNEAEVTRFNTNDPSPLYNPSKLFDINPADYDHRTLPSVTLRGKKLQVVELKPHRQSIEYSTLTLYINPTTSLPERIDIALTGDEKPIVLTLNSIMSDMAVPAGTFRFDPSKHPGVEIFDDF